MSEVPRTFDLTSNPDYQSEYMATELPVVEEVHPVMVGADELVMCVHLENVENTRHLTFPRSFLPDTPGDDPTDEERIAYAEECDERLRLHSERILRAVWN